MKKTLLLTAALLSLSATAQTTEPQKWSDMLRPLVKRATLSRAADGTMPADTLLTLNVGVKDAQSVIDYLKGEGYDATSIVPQYVIATIPASFVPTLAERADVSFVYAPRQFKPTLHTARTEMGVTKVTAGEGLDTPFDGTGVIVGVIDQGFQYDHAAFKDRVVRYGTDVKTGAMSTTAPEKDETDGVGHATHVTNIAAGSKVGDLPYYGIATGADLVLMKSDFDDPSIEQQAAAIRDYAKAEGKPWVINMSFGSNIGPHDGTTAYDQTMASLIEPGGFLVGAMGNESGYGCHATYSFEEDGEASYLCLYPLDEKQKSEYASCVYSTTTDGSKPLEITPMVLVGDSLYTLTLDVISAIDGQFATGVDQNSNRQFAEIRIKDLSKIFEVLGLEDDGYGANLFWRIKGNAGDSYHAWLNPDLNATFKSTLLVVNDELVASVEGDDDYNVDEGAASIPGVVAVASYNNTTVTFTNIKGEVRDKMIWIGEANGMSEFSCHGPSLSSEPKPTVAAVGGNVISAISKNYKDFKTDDDNNVAVYEGSYYCYSSGTSMATPAVTGIIALWLQANPELTNEQLHEVIAATSRRDQYTGEADEKGWNAVAGYGKIDAYEGLKKVLLLKDGINDVVGSAAPLTFNRAGDAYKILFNNDERRADIRLVAASGRTVRTLSLDAPRRGEEHIVDLSTLAPGVYVLQAETDGATLVKKVVVK